MKKFKKLLALSAIMAGLVSQNVYASSYISEDLVNVRAAPGTDQTIIGQLAYGEPVDMIQWDVGGAWAYVYTKFGEGFVFNPLISNTSRADEIAAIANLYPSATERLVVVDTAGYPMTYVFCGSSYNWNLETIMDCSVGNYDTPTPTGVFAIQAKRDVLYSAASDEYYVSDFQYDYDGAVCFHSTLFEKGTYNSIDDRVGCHISNGCVRLLLDDAKWIHDNCGVGTTVVVL